VVRLDAERGTLTDTARGARHQAGRPPQQQRVDGLLVVDLDGQRARYECFRPECPHRREGPARRSDLGPEGLKDFINGVKDQHLTKYHGSSR
jgi:hypothetical protein